MSALRLRANLFIDRWSQPDRLIRIVAGIAVLAALTSAWTTWAFIVADKAREDTARVDREGQRRDQLSRADVERIARRVLKLERPPRGEIRRRFEVGLSQCLDDGTCRQRISRALGVAVSPNASPGRLLDEIPRRRQAQNRTPSSNPTGSLNPPATTPTAPAPNPPATAPSTPAPAPSPAQPDTAGDLVDQVLDSVPLPNLHKLLP